MKPHKHAELIKAWADGAEIQHRWDYHTNHWSEWEDVGFPQWHDNFQYRIKPEPKPDVVRVYVVSFGGGIYKGATLEDCNLKLTFDGETGELKSAEVLK